MDETIKIFNEGSGELWITVVLNILKGRPQRDLLDLMCHKAPHTPLLGIDSVTYLDIQDRGLDFPLNEKSIFVQEDAMAYLDKCNPYDVIICSDGIEHFTKEDGLKLIEKIDKKCKTSIIFTPEGKYMVVEDSVHPDTHKSGWEVEEFNKLGYSCILFPNFHPQLNKGAIMAYKYNEI